MPNMGKTAIVYAIYLLRQGVLSIDNEGHIWRHAISSHGKWLPIERRRAENVGGKGYLKLTLSIEGNLRSVMAHRIVWEWLNGPIPEGIQVNHKDLDKRNNAPENLELVTGSGNIRHSYANGRPHPWHKAIRWREKARITDEQKDVIRRLRKQGSTLREIGGRFGLGTSHVHRICSEGRKEEE